MINQTVAFTPASFATPRLALSCADCGARILNMNGQTVEEQDMGYRRVHFDLSNGTRAFVSFCPSCAEKPWPLERIASLERQCRFMWHHMAQPGISPKWSGDDLTFKPAARAAQTWAEVQ